jgi:hypothetical protein
MDDEHVVSDPQEPSPFGRLLIAVALAASGLFCLAIGFRWISAQPSPGVPHWLVGLVGVILAASSCCCRETRARARSSPR